MAEVSEELIRFLFAPPQLEENKMKKDYAKKYQKKESNWVETFMVGFAFFGVIYLWVQLYV